MAPGSFRSLLVALLVIGGCARLLPPPRQEPTPPVRAAVDKLAERWKQFSDLRSLATMELDRPDGRDRFAGVLLVKAPASLRFEALSPFGQPFLFLVLHDDDLIVYNAATNEALLAPATADSMAKLVSLPFEPADIVSILAGRPAPPADLRRAEIGDVEVDKGRPLVLVGPNHQMRVWMDLDTGIAHEVEIAGGRYEVAVRYERDARGELTALTLSAPRARIAGRIDYQDPAINTGIAPERFTLVVPPSAKVERLR